MSPRRRILGAACTLAAFSFLSGCTTYYRVTDPASGRSYLTDDIDTNEESGAVMLKDARSGGRVTLQSSEVHKISKSDFEAELAAPQGAPVKR